MTTHLHLAQKLKREQRYNFTPSLCLHGRLQGEHFVLLLAESFRSRRRSVSCVLNRTHVAKRKRKNDCDQQTYRIVTSTAQSAQRLGYTLNGLLIPGGKVVHIRSGYHLTSYLVGMWGGGSLSPETKRSACISDSSCVFSVKGRNAWSSTLPFSVAGIRPSCQFLVRILVFFSFFVFFQSALPYLLTVGVEGYCYT